MDYPISSINIQPVINHKLQIQKVVDEVVVEKPFIITVDKVGNFTILCSPFALQDLTVGFLYSEAIIESYDDIVLMSDLDANTNSIIVKVEDVNAIAEKRNLIVTSSCGLCGSKNIEQMLQTIPQCKKTLTIKANDINLIVEKLQSKQTIFQKTGGAHAAAIFNSFGEMITMNEDVGRHNALDKAIGGCLLKNIDMHGCGVVLSSRISFEMVAKAARAGLEIILAVSAPTSLAIAAAKQWNITLCGFARNQRANVYCGAERIMR